MILKEIIEMANSVKAETRIIGPDRLFRFVECLSRESVPIDGLRNLFQGMTDGFIIHNLISEQEASKIVNHVQAIKSEHLFDVPVGRVFPFSFATISEDEERMEDFIRGLGWYNDFVRQPAVSNLILQVSDILSRIGRGYTVSPPKLLRNEMLVPDGNFRQFEPGKGGLFTHCGHLFQLQSPYYYSIVEKLKQESQLSYFVVLQNAQEGGELTIYDLLWDNVKDKDSPMGNEFVVDVKGNQIYLSEVRQMKIRPEPGDMVVFRGGPIWHRVEDIHGSMSRITFGGFLNITEDGKGVRYYS